MCSFCPLGFLSDVLFEGANKCKERREERLYLVGNKRWNALPYLAKLKHSHSSPLSENRTGNVCGLTMQLLDIK